MYLMFHFIKILALCFILTTHSIAVKIQIMCNQPKTYNEGERYFWHDITFLHHGAKFLLAILFLLVTGCKTLQKPGEFVESLKNPTTFPEIYLPAVKNTDEIVNENVLNNDENIKIVPIGENKNTSVHLVQVRKDAEIDAHYHKLHDEIVYIKRGEGILELNGTRHSVREGMMVVIPKKTVHRFVNTGEELNVAISFFSPPFDGEDVKLIEDTKKIKRKKRTIHDKAIKEREKEMRAQEGNKRKWLGLWKKEERKDELTIEDGEQAGDVIEEQKILVLTEEGKQKIEEVQLRMKEEERRIVNKMIINEKLKMLKKLKDEGLINQEEFEAEKSEIIRESGL